MTRSLPDISTPLPLGYSKWCMLSFQRCFSVECPPMQLPKSFSGGKAATCTRIRARLCEHLSTSREPIGEGAVLTILCLKIEKSLPGKGAFFIAKNFSRNIWRDPVKIIRLTMLPEDLFLTSDLRSQGIKRIFAFGSCAVAV